MTGGARADHSAPTQTLQTGAAALGLVLEPAQVAQLLRLASELALWSQSYNLTAIREPGQILTRHLLDSLSIHADLAGTTVADVGTGAGFPGLPLAIVNPSRQFTLIDSVNKKLRFVEHIARELALGNVVTRHARVEQLPPQAFDCVVTRAFAPLPRLLRWVGPLCDANTRVIAMKGRWPPEPGSEESGALPRGWRIVSLRQVVVPGLDAERHVLLLQRAAGTSRAT
jgi:16S rRNA (guanine527-N7)-methyltransferase